MAKQRFDSVKVKDANYAMIHGWMINHFNLSGNNLILFGIIYGFSQDGFSYFFGSLSYLCAFLNCSRPTIIKSINSLIQLGLIEKKPGEGDGKNGYKISEIVVSFLANGGKENLPLSGKETIPCGKESLPRSYIEVNKDNNTNSHQKFYEKLKAMISYEECEYFTLLRSKNYNSKQIEIYVDEFLDHVNDIDRGTNHKTFKSFVNHFVNASRMAEPKKSFV